jgi:signal transduction histidine kinase
LDPAEQEQLLAALARARDYGEPFQHERRLVRQDGTERWILARAVAVPDPDGVVRRFVGCVQDVTPLASARLELSRQRNLMEKLIHHAPALFAFVDRDLVYRWNNRTHCAVLGKPEDEIVGQRAQVAAPNILSRTEATIRRALTAAEVVHLTGLPIRHQAEGRDAYWDLTYVPVPGEDHRPMGVLIVATEVTDRVLSERVQAEQIARLQELDRMKDQFLGIVSHELRTPLNAVAGFGSLLADGVPGSLNTEQQRYVERMLDATDALLILIDDLLDMSRIQAGKFSVSFARIDLMAIVSRVIDQLRPTLDARGHVLEVSVTSRLPQARGDERRLGQVIANLLSNAVKFTPAGGRIALDVRVAGDTLRVEITDTGPGIPPEAQQRLFQPFSQVDTSPTRVYGGTGLGLSIARGLVEAHGGEIGVASVVSGGSRFWFTVPLAEADPPC